MVLKSAKEKKTASRLLSGELTLVSAMSLPRAVHGVAAEMNGTRLSTDGLAHSDSP